MRESKSLKYLLPYGIKKVARQSESIAEGKSEDTQEALLIHIKIVSYHLYQNGNELNKKKECPWRDANLKKIIKNKRFKVVGDCSHNDNGQIQFNF